MNIVLSSSSPVRIALVGSVCPTHRPLGRQAAPRLALTVSGGRWRCAGCVPHHETWTRNYSTYAAEANVCRQSEKKQQQKQRGGDKVAGAPTSARRPPSVDSAPKRTAVCTIQYVPVRVCARRANTVPGLCGRCEGQWGQRPARAAQSRVGRGGAVAAPPPLSFFAPRRVWTGKTVYPLAAAGGQSRRPVSAPGRPLTPPEIPRHPHHPSRPAAPPHPNTLCFAGRATRRRRAAGVRGPPPRPVGAGGAPRWGGHRRSSGHAADLLRGKGRQGRGRLDIGQR